MMENIEVNMGDLVVSKGPENLTTSAVGSCLVIMIYDTKFKIGALAHTMLTDRRVSHLKRDALDATSSSARTREGGNERRHEIRDMKYVDAAIDEMIKKMVTQGANKENLEAKLVGGANMFPALKSDIGKENVLAAKKKLKEEGIRLVGESVGGSQGRSVEFSVASGIVTVKIKF